MHASAPERNTLTRAAPRGASLASPASGRGGSDNLRAGWVTPNVSNPSPACGRGDSRASAAGEGVPGLAGKSPLTHETGFTLVEVLVALGIFSLAALALLRLQGAAITTTARLDEKAFAQIVAQNQAVEALLAQAPPAYGSSSGNEANGGRSWRWTRNVARTPDPRLQRIDVAVAGPDGSTAASLTIIRRAS